MEGKESLAENSILLELLKENWAHGRHVESERLDFTSIYVAIVGGTLAFIGNDFNIKNMCPIFAFLLIFSFLGFQLSQKWGNVFDEHMKKVEKILNELAKEGVKGIEFMEFPSYKVEKPISGSWKKIKDIFKNWKRTKNLFNIFYIIMMIIWSSLFIFSLFQNFIS